jgi:branched-chain amino acid transport system substrate-binding protein
MRGSEAPRASERRRALVVLAALPHVALAGCTLTKFDHAGCEDHAECRAVFGFGAVCNAEGLCQNASPIARCGGAPFPEDLFLRPELYRDAVVVGSLMDHSSGAHLVREKAVRMAVKEASQAGGLEGHKVAAVFCDIAEDSRYDALPRSDAAAAAAEYLSATLGISAIVGPLASDDTMRVSQRVRSTDTVVMSPAATSLSLGALEPPPSDAAPGLLWRVAPPDSLQGTVIADDMLERNVTEAVVIRESGLYGDGLAQVFQDRFTSKGGHARVEAIEADTQIAEKVVAAAGDGAQDVLFISSQQDWVIKFLNAASGQSGYQSKEIFLTDAAANQAVLDGAAVAAPLFSRVRGTRPAPRSLDDYVFASFAADYKAQYAGEDPTTATFSAHAYDGTWLVLYGAAWSLLREGGVSGMGIARGLRNVSSGANINVIPSSWQLVLSAFRMGGSVNLSGASGEIDFDPETKNVTAPVEIWHIDSIGGQATIAHVSTKTPGG